MHLFIFFPLSLIVLTLDVEAGLNKYTYLDQIDEWIIESKFDNDSQQILCRASIPSASTWFSNRVHLDKYDEVVIPNHLPNSENEKKYDLENILKALKKCRSGLIYIP